MPQIINDYNHWLLGVDLVDQLTAYYWPKIRCHCTWMPLFLHGVDIIRANLYVLYKETAYRHLDVNDDDVGSHMQFIILFINSLICRAMDENTAKPVTQTSTPVGNVIHLNKPAQLWLSRKRPSLSIFDHVQFLPGKYDLIRTKQRKCKNCQYSCLVAKLAQGPIPTEERPTTECRIYHVNVCKNHKSLFHTK